MIPRATAKGSTLNLLEGVSLLVAVAAVLDVAAADVVTEDKADVSVVALEVSVVL